MQRILLKGKTKYEFFRGERNADGYDCGTKNKNHNLQPISVQCIDPGFWNMIRPCMIRPSWFDHNHVTLTRSVETAVKLFDNKREAEPALCKIKDDNAKSSHTDCFLPEEQPWAFGSISCGCRCHHSRQNIFCDQKLANAHILSLTDRQTFDQRNTFCKDFFDYKLYFPSICILFEFWASWILVIARVDSICITSAARQ